MVTLKLGYVMANTLFSPSILLTESIETGQIAVEKRTSVPRDFRADLSG